jgi:hypothetical protein
MRFLREEIFDHEFYCPVGERRVEFVMSLEKSMRILSRDEVSPSPVTFRLTRNKTRQLTVLIPKLISCCTCRSETYTVITNCHDFVARREQRCDGLTERLSAIIGFFTPSSDKRELYPLVRNSIPEPALSLAHKMHLSVDRFSIEWSPIRESKLEQHNTFGKDFNDFEFVNLL